MKSLQAGDVLDVSQDVSMKVESLIGTRMIRVSFNKPMHFVLGILFDLARPIQYSYLDAPLKLFEVQTVFAGKPWSLEMPSAIHALRWWHVRSLLSKGVQIASLTHAAGISTTGDEDLDKLLPFPEKFEIPESTIEAINSAHMENRRIIALGTSAARAIEGSLILGNGKLVSKGVTDLKIGPHFKPQRVRGILTGMHDVETSHFSLLNAFASTSVLTKAFRQAEKAGFLQHEFGDSCLLL